MTITPELTAQILRYHHAERWPVGTISSQLNVHRDTVMRVLTQAGVVPIVPVQRPSGVTPYLPFIEQTLKQFPNLTASRLYAMVVERGYGGRPDHFRHVIARHRPRPHADGCTWRRPVGRIRFSWVAFVILNDKYSAPSSQNGLRYALFVSTINHVYRHRVP